MLDDRKLKVLYAIISSYIDTAEPIGSRTISKTYDLGVSSATIRNEMSDLEELGYLSKPHSSAGRVPSDKAYRLYVDELLNIKESLDNELTLNEKLITFLMQESNEINQLIENAAKALSDITNYTSIVATPKMTGIVIERIQLVGVEGVGALILVICNNGVIKDSLYKSYNKIDMDDLNILSNILNKKFKAYSAEEVYLLLSKENLNDYGPLKSLMVDIVPILKSILNELISIDIYSGGITKILNFPEYKDVEKAKEFMSFVEDKDQFIDVLLKSSTSDDIDIIIGSENIYSPIKDISIITAAYSIDGKIIGKVGLLGPTRMDYQNLIKTVKIFSENITQVMNILIGS